MYATYHFYEQSFGGTMPEADFTRAAAKAETIIRSLTYPNGDIFARKDDNVKLAVCAAAEVVYHAGKQAGGTAGMKSESNDGYSVSYVTEAQDGQTVEELLQRKIAAAVRPYLLPTGWLSRRARIRGCRDACAGCSYHL